MQIKRLVIENFKSIERVKLEQPNPFTVFVGPNGSGKSNIFEALEFVAAYSRLNYSDEVVRMFGGAENLTRRSTEGNTLFKYELVYDSPFVDKSVLHYSFDRNNIEGVNAGYSEALLDNAIRQYSTSYPVRQFIGNFRHLFVDAPDRKTKKALEYIDTYALSFSASNLEAVLKRILKNDLLREEIHEWLDLFVPGFKAVEVDDRNELHWFETSSDRYFTKDLISDGTYNILAILTAVYQSDEPQFLCIEEPENGIHPQVQMTLIEFFRKICAEKGHYIWLNTHSEAVVRKLTTDELVLVDKKDGVTRTKQNKDRNIYDLPTDEAWLTGMLGGGLPW